MEDYPNKRRFDLFLPPFFFSSVVNVFEGCSFFFFLKLVLLHITEFARGLHNKADSPPPFFFCLFFLCLT